MALQVLQNKKENTCARREMQSRGIDFSSCRLSGMLRNYGIMEGINVGDVTKSWDVLKSVNFIQSRLSLSDPMLDIGAYCSEILPILNKLQYLDLTGIDLNDNLRTMPGNDRIHYQVADFHGTSFDNESFAAITAISVIEHGFDSDRLLTEVSRLLRPGGYFIASVDYWSDKIDTAGIKAFGMDWMIFSQADMEKLLTEAARYGLLPVGELDFATDQAPIRWLGKSYTFAWFALQKLASSA